MKRQNLAKLKVVTKKRNDLLSDARGIKLELVKLKRDMLDLKAKAKAKGSCDWRFDT